MKIFIFLRISQNLTKLKEGAFIKTGRYYLNSSFGGKISEAFIFSPLFKSDFWATILNQYSAWLYQSKSMLIMWPNVPH